MSAKNACIATIDHFATLRGLGSMRMKRHRGAKAHSVPLSLKGVA